MRRIAVMAAGLTAIAMAGCSSSGSGEFIVKCEQFGFTDRVDNRLRRRLADGNFHPARKAIRRSPSGRHGEVQLRAKLWLVYPDHQRRATADVFASAAPANMETVVKAGDAASPQDFAKNTMEVAVPPSNPAKVTSVTDLAKKSPKVALCQPQVPCGVVAAEVFKNAAIKVKPVTLQPDVKSVLTQVETGNVDAGMVYVTDVMAAGTKVKGVAIPGQRQRLDALPDRYHQRQQAQVHRAGLHGLRAVPCGPEGAESRGVAGRP